MRALFLTVTLSLVGCGSDFDPGSRITSTRLLGVRADQPFARPGERVSLEALALDPSSRPITFGWALCVRPAAPTVAGCLATFDRATFVAGAASTYAFDVPTNAMEGLAPSATAIIGVVTVACPGALSLGDTSGAPFTCAVAGRALPLDQFDVGMKRVVVRARDRNENPTLTRVTFDGVDWPEDQVPEITSTCDERAVKECGDDAKHSIVVQPARAESGVDEQGAPFSEQLVVQYYSTEGTFESQVRTGDAPGTTFVARSRAAGTTVTLVLVARDDRGGVTWTTRRARVR